MGIVAYIHTSHVLIPLFTELSRREMPEVDVFHMVDESLIKNTIREQKLTKTTIRRVASMVESAHEGGADAVVVTCSSIGPAVSMAQRLFDFPVIRVDDAMAELAVRSGRRIGVAAT
ncbi:MAG: Asp/Glu/hydantoin racemase, partial [Acidobacteria bacterium]|nr:Asp/Glu/hydantoin racemase [Acidobacteriota bacterium]